MKKNIKSIKKKINILISCLFKFWVNIYVMVEMKVVNYFICRSNKIKDIKLKNVNFVFIKYFFLVKKYILHFILFIFFLLAVIFLLKSLLIIYQENLSFNKEIFSLDYVKLFSLNITLFFFFLSFKKSKVIFLNKLYIKLFICFLCVVTDKFIGLNSFNEFILIPIYNVLSEPILNAPFLLKVSISAISLFIASFLLNCKYLSEIVILKQEQTKYLNLQKEQLKNIEQHVDMLTPTNIDIEKSLEESLKRNDNLEHKIIEKDKEIFEKTKELVEQIKKNENLAHLNTNYKACMEHNQSQYEIILKDTAKNFNAMKKDYFYQNDVLRRREITINDLTLKQINCEEEIDDLKVKIQNLKIKISLIEEANKNRSLGMETYIKDLEQKLKTFNDNNIFQNKEQDFEKYIKEILIIDDNLNMILSKAYKGTFDNISSVFQSYLQNTLKGTSNTFIYIFKKFCSFFTFDDYDEDDQFSSMRKEPLDDQSQLIQHMKKEPLDDQSQLIQHMKKEPLDDQSELIQQIKNN
jgi:hypothetical protein